MSTDVDPGPKVFKVNRDTCFHFMTTGLNTHEIAPKKVRLVEGDLIEVGHAKETVEVYRILQTIYKDEHRKARKHWPLLVTVVLGPA